MPSWRPSSRTRRRPSRRTSPRERTALLFSGEYDDRNALLTISAGAGGTEATDWAEMLLRMYLRWAERHRFRTEIVDQQEGEQAGLKSVTVAVDGRRAYGWLRAERGVHRLVRISPYDAQKRRQTTFALVEVLPEAEDDVEIELNWDEIRVDTFRLAGRRRPARQQDRLGGPPDPPARPGIVAQSQNERSQTQNKETAIRVLKARLLERALEEKEAEIRKLKGEHVEAGWGNQIRSYVLHPYQMVKDLRTSYETCNTGGGPRRRPRRVHAGRARAAGDRRPERRRRRRRRRGAPTPATTRSPEAASAAAGRSIGGTFRPRRRGPRGLRGDLARRPQRLPRPLASTRSADNLAPSSGSTPTPWRPIPDGFGVAEQRRAAGERGSSAFASAVAPRPVWFLSMLFVQPGGAGRRRRPGAPGADPAARAGDATLGDRHRQRPADLQRPVRLARDRAPPADVQPRRPAGRGRGACAPCPTASGRCRSADRRRSGRRATAQRPRRRAGRPRSRASSASTTRQDHASAGPGPDRLPVPRRRGGTLLGYGYASRGRPGRPDRARDPALHAPIVGHLLGAVAPRGASASGCRARPRAIDRRSSGRASGWRASRSSCAGRARSPTSAATCRSRPGSS